MGVLAKGNRKNCWITQNGEITTGEKIQGVQLFLCKAKPALSSEDCVGEFKAALGLHRQSCPMSDEDCQQIRYKFAISEVEHPRQMYNQIPESTGCLLQRPGSAAVP